MRAHEEGQGLKEYPRIESRIKKRTIEALVATKHSHHHHQPRETTPPDKQIRSETFLKIGKAPPDSVDYSPTKP